MVETWTIDTPLGIDNSISTMPLVTVLQLDEAQSLLYGATNSYQALQDGGSN